MARLHPVTLLPSAFALALLSACPQPKQSCKDTGCPVGSSCNQTSGRCELTAQGGGAGGGGATGGGGGGGGAMGGGDGGALDSGIDAGIDAGPVDPFDDGGVFVAGDICGRAITVPFDGGTRTVLSVDLSAAQDQYRAACNALADGGAPRDLLFTFTLAEPKGLTVAAIDTSDAGALRQVPVLALIASPCIQFTQVACIDTKRPTPKELTLDRLPAGTYYVLLENSGSGLLDGTYDVLFELADPPPAPANDTCMGAQALTFDGGTTITMGTTLGAFNDTAGSPLWCSAPSALNPDVFYQLTLAQPQDVEVAVWRILGSQLVPAIALTNQCGAGSRINQRGCAKGQGGTFKARSVPAGTYYVVVDSDSAVSGAFGLRVTLSPPLPLPPNDTCAAPATLVPNMTQVVDVNTAPQDYAFSCANPRGGDVVYQFTIAVPQRVTVTATSLSGDAGVPDGVLSLRTAPCELESSEVVCADDSLQGPEVLVARNLPPGTYYVVLSADSPATGRFSLQMTLGPVRPTPTNENCATAEVVTLTGGMATRSVDLGEAMVDIDSDLCSTDADGQDVVYQVTIPPMRTLRVVGTPQDPDLDPVLFAMSTTCVPPSRVCADDNAGGDPEVLDVPNNTGAPLTVSIVAKVYDISSPGVLDLTFTLL